MNSNIKNELKIILDKVSSFCNWEISSRIIHSSNLITDKKELEFKINRIKELSESYINHDFYFLNSTSPESFIQKTAIKGNIFEKEEIESFYLLVKNSKKFYEKFNRKEEFPVNNEISNQIPVEFIKEFKNKFDFVFENNKFVEGNIPQVSILLNQINQKNEEILGKINSFINQNEEKLSDTFYKYVDDRYVIPFKRTNTPKKNVLAHYYSDSGATLYGEPFWLVELNNSIIELKGRKKKIIYNFFKKISNFIIENNYFIKQMYDFFIKADIAFAKSKYLALNKTYPYISSRIYLSSVHNPLIEEKKSIPADIIFTEDKDLFLITGPNAGGKTVVLKTLYYSALLFQMAIPISCDEGSEIPVFSQVFGVFGDESSILNDMSTFSWHLKQISDILASSDEKTIVLIDEITSGTDPEEGAALAVAIIEEFIEKKVKVAITTHINKIKYHFFKKSFVQSVSMLFDIKKNIPLFKLDYNSVNSSYAFEIAKKSGIDRLIINKAMKYRKENSFDTEEFIKALKDEKEKLRIEKEKIIKNNIYLEEKQKDLDFTRNKIEKDMNKKFSKKLDKLEKEFSEYRTKALDKFEKVKSKKDVADFYEPVIQIKKIKKTLNPQEELPKLLKPQAKDLKKGSEVFIKSLNTEGILEKKEKGKIVVSIKGKIFTTDFNNIFLKKEKKSEKNKSKTKVKMNSPEKSEIKVIGLNIEDGIEEVEKFLQLAFCYKTSIIRIVHGKGILRKEILKYLKNDKRIKKIEFADYFSGQDGVSVVELNL
ncbi:MAG: endonuclease MutS2 [Candidatus Muiribacteriota bacterium]